LHDVFFGVGHAFVLMMVSPVGITLYNDDMFGGALRLSVMIDSPGRSSRLFVLADARFVQALVTWVRLS